MARIDYYAIEQELQAILEAATELDGCKVSIEEEVLFGAENTPLIAIYLENRESPIEQSLSLGSRQRYILRFSLWVWCYGLELAQCTRARDEIIGKLELVLMRNRTMNDMVSTSWIEGGELHTARNPDRVGLFVGGEVILRADVTASN